MHTNTPSRHACARLTLGAVLRQLRTDKQLSQTAAARHLGIRQQAYSHYETGRVEIPIARLLTLCTLYQCDVAPFLSYYLGDIATAEGHPDA